MSVCLFISGTDLFYVVYCFFLLLLHIYFCLKASNSACCKKKLNLNNFYISVHFMIPVLFFCNLNQFIEAYGEKIYFCRGFPDHANKFPAANEQSKYPQRLRESSAMQQWECSVGRPPLWNPTPPWWCTYPCPPGISGISNANQHLKKAINYWQRYIKKWSNSRHNKYITGD